MTPTTAAAELPEWLRGERARPTFPVLVGAAGALVAQFGAFLLLEDVEPRDLRAFGLGVAALSLAIGLCLTFLERRGALHVAGVALSATAVLPLAIAVVAEPNELDGRTDVLPASLLAVLVWLLLFAFSPARGHGLFLGLALFGAWLAAESQVQPTAGWLWLTPFTAVDAAETRRVEPPATIVIPEQSIPTFTVPTFSVPRPVFPEPVVPVPEPGRTTEQTFPPFPTFPELREERMEPEQPPEQQQTSFGRAELVASTQSDEEPERFPEPPLAPGVVSMAFGAVYLAMAALLDRARLPRPAGAFVAVGAPALALGIVAIGPNQGATATSVFAVAFGFLLLAIGVGGRRRFSAWFGVAALAGGAAGLTGEAFGGQRGSGEAVAMVLAGAALVAAGWWPSQPGRRPS